MSKVHCIECFRICEHLDKAPIMIQGDRNWFGTKYYCCLCAGTRIFNLARIIELRPEKKFGFIKGKEENFFFHYSDCDSTFIPRKGMLVNFEIAFLKDQRYSFKAINIKPASRKDGRRK